MIRMIPTGDLDDLTLILSRPDHTHLGRFEYVENVHLKLNFNNTSELSFVSHVPSKDELDKLTEEERKQILFLHEELNSFKYVYVKEIDTYFAIDVEVNEDAETVKEVSGHDAVELDQIMIFAMEINSEADIARDEYTKPTIFFDRYDPENSLLHRALSKVPNWHIGHVDESLWKIQRTFSVSNSSIYDFLHKTVADEVGCYFDFDTANRVVDVYEAYSICNNPECKHRGDFEHICPMCDGTDITKGFGEDTTVYIDVENLADNVQYSTDMGSVKNTFRLEAGDDNMTANVRNINPNGSDYIYYFSDEMKHEMPEALVTRLEEYDKLYKAERPKYMIPHDRAMWLMEEISRLTHTMMPDVELPKYTAKDEVQYISKLMDYGRDGDFDPKVAILDLKSSTAITSIRRAVTEMVKFHMRPPQRFKVSVEEVYNEKTQKWEHTDSWEYVPTGLGNKVKGFWSGTVILENWSTRDEKDKEDRDEAKMILRVALTDDYEHYMEQFVNKYIKDKDNDQGSVFEVLKIKEDKEFEEACQLYCLNRLISFRDAIQGCISIMVEADQSSRESELKEFYDGFLSKLKIVQKVIDERQTQIDNYQREYDRRIADCARIQKKLNFQNFLGEELFNTFCIYRREDTYKNENYISDDLDTIVEQNNMAKQFFSRAQEELKKSAERKHTIRATVHNLLAMPEFEPLLDGFKLGNFIHIRVDGKLYRLRLVSMGLNGHGATNIEVEFSDAYRSGTGYTDIKAILDSAKDMATSYDAYKHQMDKNTENTAPVKDWVENGFSATLKQISNDAERQEVSITDKGMILRKLIEFTQSDYEPFQTMLMGSGIYFTTDSWNTLKAALGKYVFPDPEDNGKMKEAYGLLAETIVGQIILGQALKIFCDDNSKTMTFDDKGLILNAKGDQNGKYQKIFSVQKDGNDRLYIDTDGNLVLETTGADVQTPWRMILKSNGIYFQHRDHGEWKDDAYLTGDTLHINKSEVLTEQRIGNFAWEKSIDGGLRLRKVK